MADLDTPAVNRKREFSDTSCSIKSEEAVCAEESRASKRNKTHDSLDRGSNSQTANVNTQRMKPRSAVHGPSRVDRRHISRETKPRVEARETTPPSDLEGTASNRDSASNKTADTALPYEVTEDWMLDPIISRQSKMLVVVRGSLPSPSNPKGWHSGDYESVQAIVHSIYNTGIGNTAFPSTARVKFTRALEAARADTIYTVPISILWPVEPAEVGDCAMVLHGKHQGQIAKLREQVDIGWYVSIGQAYFEIESEKLVKVST